MSRPFTDQYGTELTIAGETALPGCARIGISERCGAHIPAEDFPEFIAALYTAAGKPEPVILERPGATFEGGVNRAGSVEVGRLRDRVTVGLYGIQPEEIKPDEARRLAALIAIRAAEIEEDEPDPAEVEELAALIRSELYPHSESIGLRPSESDRTAARAALRWMRDKERAS